MRLLLLIVVPPMLIFGLAVALMLVPLSGPFPAPQSGARNLLAAVTTGVLGLAYLATLTVYVISVFFGLGRVADPLLRPAGFEARSIYLFGRRYRGTLQGRRLEVSFIPGPILRPSVLDLRVAVATGSRAAIGRGRPLLDCRDCPQAPLTRTRPGPLQVFCHDQAWVERVLDQSAVWSAAEQLLQGQGSAELYLQPEQLWLRRHPGGLTEQELQRLIQTALILADALTAA